MITLTAADGTVTMMTEAEFLASRPTTKKPHEVERTVVIRRKAPYTPQGDGVNARFTR